MKGKGYQLKVKGQSSKKRKHKGKHDGDGEPTDGSVPSQPHSQSDIDGDGWETVGPSYYEDTEEFQPKRKKDVKEIWKEEERKE